MIWLFQSVWCIFSIFSGSYNVDPRRTRQRLFVTESEAGSHVLGGCGGGAPGKATRLYMYVQCNSRSVDELTGRVLEPFRGLGVCCLRYTACVT